MTCEQRASEIISQDDWMMQCLHTVRDLNLNDWYIGAGFVRNKLWDVLHEYPERTPLNDVDVVYFDRINNDPADEKALEQKLLAQMPDVPWSVLNLANIHLRYDQAPFNDTTHAISFWPEVPTCVGVRLEADDTLTFTAPFGMDDIFNLVVKRNHTGNLPAEVYPQRMAKKQWHKIWPKLLIES